MFLDLILIWLEFLKISAYNLCAPLKSCQFETESSFTVDTQIWATVSYIDQKKAPGVAYQSNLSYHSSAVNALRFSPSGKFTYCFSCRQRCSIVRLKVPIAFLDDFVTLKYNTTMEVGIFDSSQAQLSSSSLTSLV